MNDFLDRIDIKEPIGKVVEEICAVYKLGKLQENIPILRGYQDCNLHVVTSKGHFVVKIYWKDRPKKRIDEVIWGYDYFRRCGVPLPELMKTDAGTYLYALAGLRGQSYASVFRFIHGPSLADVTVRESDILEIVRTMTLFHSSRQKIDNYYDTLGIMQLVPEFSSKKQTLMQDELNLVLPALEEFKSLPFETFRKSVIHGTLEKENMIRDDTQKLHILDLGCMDFNYSILDIATLIANFSLGLSRKDSEDLIWLVIGEYQQVRTLQVGELESLIPLVRAQFAQYLIGMASHFRGEQDTSEQTKLWLQRGRHGLEQFAGLNINF